MTRRRRYQRSLGDASAMARATDAGCAAAGIRDDDFGDDREAMESPTTRVIANRDGHIGDDSTLRVDADACGRLPAAMPGSVTAWRWLRHHQVVMSSPSGMTRRSCAAGTSEDGISGVLRWMIPRRAGPPVLPHALAISLPGLVTFRLTF